MVSRPRLREAPHKPQRAYGTRPSSRDQPAYRRPGRPPAANGRNRLRQASVHDMKTDEAVHGVVEGLRDRGQDLEPDGPP